MKKVDGFQYIRSLGTRLFPSVKRETSLPLRQQKTTFTIYSAALLAGLLSNLCGLSGPHSGEAPLLNAVFLAVVLSLLLAYRAGKLPLRRAFCAMTVAAQLFTCNEMLLCALSPSAYGLMLIVGNMVLLAVNLMFSLIAYLKRVPYVLGGMAIATYAACMFLTGDAALKNFFVLYLVMLLAISLLGSLLAGNIRRLHEENSAMKMEEEEIFHVLKMEKEQVLAYIRLAKQRHATEDTDRILDLLGERSRENVIHNVREAMVSRELERRGLSGIFPELTPSEIEICRLVILGKTLNEVCAILGKSEGNITSQRSNIRRKLGLKPSDNLKKVLQARFDEKKNG